MALYDFVCDACGVEIERIVPSTTVNIACPKCGSEMRRKIALPALIRIKGQGYPSRKKWMDNWTPQSEPFSTGSLHGERY